MDFTYYGRTLELFDHLYNLTMLNERCVELAIVNDWLGRYWAGTGRTLLEVGNVLGHYGPDRANLVIDQFEEAAWHQEVGVVNADLFECGYPYKADLIVSISTIEHIGTDYPSEHDPLEAIDHLRRLLLPGGDMIITAPTGISSVLDAAIAEDLTGAALSTTFTKRGHPYDWRQDDAPSVSAYGVADAWAQTVWIGEFGPLEA